MSEYLWEKEKYSKDRSISVEELIKVLQGYPKEMKVMITWESTVNEFKKENIYISVTGTLYFDADGNFYKKDFSKNPKENERKINLVNLNGLNREIASPILINIFIFIGLKMT